jgi:hypothetical protein
LIRAQAKVSSAGECDVSPQRRSSWVGTSRLSGCRRRACVLTWLTEPRSRQGPRRRLRGRRLFSDDDGKYVAQCRNGRGEDAGHGSRRVFGSVGPQHQRCSGSNQPQIGVAPNDLTVVGRCARPSTTSQINHGSRKITPQIAVAAARTIGSSMAEAAGSSTTSRSEVRCCQVDVAVFTPRRPVTRAAAAPRCARTRTRVAAAGRASGNIHRLKITHRHLAALCSPHRDRPAGRSCVGRSDAEIAKAWRVAIWGKLAGHRSDESGFPTAGPADERDRG